MGCGGSKQTSSDAQPARTAKPSYKPTGPGRTLGDSATASSAPTGGATKYGAINDPSRPTAGNAAALAAAKREEALKATRASANTKLKPQPLSPGANKSVTDSDTLAWN